MTRKMKDSGVEWIGEIPESWELAKIGQHFKQRNEKVSDLDFKPLSVTKNGIVPQLDNAAKSSNHNDRKLVKKGDFVINSRSDRKQSSGIAYENGSVSLINLVIKSRTVDTNFTNYLLKNAGFAEEFYRWGNGIVADLWSTKWDSMKRIPIPLPELAEQKKIANVIRDKVKIIDTIISETQQSIDELKKYKQALITETVTKGLDKNAEMKDSGIEWIGKISSTFQLPKLGSVTLKIGSGKTPSGGESVYVPEGILFLRSQNIYDEGLEISSPRFISEEIDEQMSGTRVMQGDVLLNITGGSIGRSTVYTLNQPANVNQHVCIIRTSEETLLPEWLNLCLMSNIGKQSVLFFQTGGNREGLNFADISKIRIPLPTLSTQKEIIRYLSGKLQHIQVLINQKEEAVKVYSEYKNSLIYEYVTGKKEA